MSKKTTSNAFQQSAAQPPGSTPKRVKVTLACIVCRKKKVKCDGIQPSCSRCNSMGLACEYSDPPRKRGPPKGYIEVIENRAHRIESLLALHPQLKMHQQPITSKVTMPMTTTIPKTTNINFQHHLNNNSIIHTRDQPNSLLSAGPNTLLNLVSNAIVSSSLHDDHSNNNGDKIKMLNAPGSHNRQSDFSLNNELEWAESFFAHFNLFFPILSRQHFLYQLQHRPQEMDPLLRYAVLALGCRYAETQKSHEDAGAQFFKQCQQILNTISLSHDNNNSNITLSKLQAVVIMCWYAYLSGDMQMCRTYLHKQVQMVKELKLHRDPDLSLGIVTMELRRRVFWVAYVTNQWLACCLGSDPYFLHQETYWNCRWPQLEDSQLQAIDSRNLMNMQHVSSSVEYALQITVFSEMIKLARILDDHHHSDSSNNDNKDKSTINALTNWFLNLPSYLEYNQSTDHGPPSPMIRVYHMLYYSVQIMLHHHPSSLDTLGVCNTAANTIVHIAEQMIRHQQERYLYNTYLLSLCLATSIHLDNARNNKTMPISLSKSIRVFKNANCTRLCQTDFNQALDHYIQNEYHISLEKEDEQLVQPPVSNRKRKRSSDQKSRTVAKTVTEIPSSNNGDSTPPVVTASPSLPAATSPAVITGPTNEDMNQLDINDLLGLTGLFNEPTNNSNDVNNVWDNNYLPNWLTTTTTVNPMITTPPITTIQQHELFSFPMLETSSSSSGSLSSPTNSSFSPTHSPALSCDTSFIVQQQQQHLQLQSSQSQQDYQQQKNNQIDQNQFLMPYLDTLPFGIYAWDDFIMPHDNNFNLTG
ncbi:fungal-specific transcription factor domain-containing protein [Circinella umbellata]|nr:fungal-specific transcription factor domain-containing protein [Circinella umbellata]